MKMFVLSILASVVLLATVTASAGMKKQSKEDVVQAITQMENDGVKASLAGDISFVQKTYADDWTGGFSGGIWTTKDSLLTDSKDTTNNKMNTQQISDLKVRVYGDSTAIATYTNTYDGMIRGEHRIKTVLTTDTFVRQNGEWKAVASHSCVAK
jgi:ketosteroid isomerase-like protein